MPPKSQFLSYKVQNGTNLTSNAGHLQIHLYLQNRNSLSTIFTLIKVSSTSSSQTAKMTRSWTEGKKIKLTSSSKKRALFPHNLGHLFIFYLFFQFLMLLVKLML